MESGYGEASNVPPPESESSSGNNSIDTGDFECNICFDLSQDSIVTLCGHLFCWPCLYKWLHYHSHSHECPVCKALVEEDKLVPLYGRGRTQTDPRSKSYPGIDIPNRPTGQRPQTAPPPLPDANPFSNYGLGGFMGVPMTTAREIRERIDEIANKKHNDRVYRCKKLYEARGNRGMPRELKGKYNEWHAMVRHCQSLGHMQRPKKMKEYRNKKLNHSSGPIPFKDRLMEELGPDLPDPGVEHWFRTYGKHNAGKPQLEIMAKKRQNVREEQQSSSDPPLPQFDTDRRIFENAHKARTNREMRGTNIWRMGERRETKTRRVHGSSSSRPPPGATPEEIVEMQRKIEESENQCASLKQDLVEQQRAAREREQLAIEMKQHLQDEL